MKDYSRCISPSDGWELVTEGLKLCAVCGPAFGMIPLKRFAWHKVYENSKNVSPRRWFYAEERASVCNDCLNNPNRLSLEFARELQQVGQRDDLKAKKKNPNRKKKSKKRK